MGDVERRRKRAMLFGILIFNEYPDLLAIVGVMVIAAAGLLTVVRERIRRLRPSSPPGIR